VNDAIARPELREVPIGLIDDPALPSRINPDDESIDGLAERMRAIGFISTLALKRKGERFEVIAGHRRLLAARRAGIVAVPSLVYPSDAAHALAIQQAENVERKQLTAAEEAIWFDELLELEPDGGTDGVAARVGEKRGYVEGRLALLHGDEHVFRALQDEKIPIGVAQQLNRCTQQQYRRMFLDNAIRHGATVTIVSGWIAEWKRDLEPATRDAFAAGAPAPASPPITNDYFTCHACQSKDHPQRMIPINFHDYCLDANVKPALELWHRRGDYIKKPRTLADAADLVSELLDDWPDLGRCPDAEDQAETQH